jgi:Family of unknown function (DUF5662)
MNPVDKSKIDTQAHQEVVKMYIERLVSMLHDRASYHDATKLMSPELEVFAEYTPKLAKTTFGSPEYDDQLKDMQIALKHHYANNRHHPEHFPNGVRGMNLIDLLEMVADWKASSLRQHTGNALVDIEKNQERFGYSDDLAAILKNTVELFELI